MNQQTKDILSKIIAHERMRFEAIKKSADAMSAEARALMAQNKIFESQLWGIKEHRLLQRSVEIFLFIRKLEAILDGASVDETYDAFADKDDFLITESKKEAV